MRYILAVVAIILLAIMLWPWIEQFLKWIRKEYNKATTFTQTKKETTTNDDNEKSD